MISLLIQSILALLLVTCIVYCIRLERRLRVFQAANQQLGETVAQLTRKSQDAEQAILRFKEAAGECEAQITAPLHAARSLSTKLEQQLDDAETIMDKIGRIVMAAAPSSEMDRTKPADKNSSSAPKRSAVKTERSSLSRFAGIG